MFVQVGKLSWAGLKRGSNHQHTTAEIMNNLSYVDKHWHVSWPRLGVVHV